MVTAVNLLYVRLYLIGSSDHRCVAQDARLISCEHQGGADTEPDKNVARAHVVYATDRIAREELRLFFKLPTAREWSVLYKAAIVTFTNDMKEMAFYNDVLPEFARQAGGREASRLLTTPPVSRRALAAGPGRSPSWPGSGAARRGRRWPWPRPSARGRGRRAGRRAGRR